MKKTFSSTGALAPSILKAALLASVGAYLLAAGADAHAVDAHDCIRIEVMKNELFDRIHNSCNREINVHWYDANDVNKGYGPSATRVPPRDFVHISDVEGGVYYAACVAPDSPSGFRTGGRSYTCD